MNKQLNNMRYIILTLTLLFSLSSISQVVSIESLQKELQRQKNIFYDDTKFYMSGITFYTQFNLKKADKEFFQDWQVDGPIASGDRSYKNVIYPYNRNKDHYTFVAYLPWNGIGYWKYDYSDIDIKIIKSFFSKVITKEKIIEFLKKNKINNNRAYRSLNLTEIYSFGYIKNNESWKKYLKDNGMEQIIYESVDWQVHFETTDNPQYGDNEKIWRRGKDNVRTFLLGWKIKEVLDKDLEKFLESNPNAIEADGFPKEVRRIQIFPKDLDDIPESSVFDFPKNVRKISEFFRTELIEFARKESGQELSGDYFEAEGDAKRLEGNDVGAEKDFSKAIELYEKKGEGYAFPNVYLKRGDIRIKLGNREGGIKDLEKGLEYYPSNPKAYNIYVRIAEAKIFLKKTYEAIFDCNKAIELKPNLAYAYGVRGVAKATINDISGACADVKKAAQLGNAEYEKMLGPICDRNE